MTLDPIIGNWVGLEILRSITLAVTLLAASSVCVLYCRKEPYQWSRILYKSGFLFIALGYLVALWDHVEHLPLHAALVNLGIIIVSLRTIVVSGNKLRQRVNLKKNPA